MTISILLFLLCALYQPGELIQFDNVCINSASDEYSIIGTFFQLLNGKFVDETFNPLQNITSTEWSLKRLSEAYNIDSQTSLKIPINVHASGSVKCVFNIRNDKSDKYKIYWINGNGKPIFKYELGTGTYGLLAYVGDYIYFKNSNLNKSEVLVVKIGEPPFNNTECFMNLEYNSNVYNLSQITTTVDDFIEKPYIFDNSVDSSNVYVPDGVSSSSNTLITFSFTLVNDKNSYTGYFINSNGTAIARFNLSSQAIKTVKSYKGAIWFLKNKNPDKPETLYIKLGKVPFWISGTTVDVSSIVSTVEDIIPISSLHPYGSRQSQYIDDSYILQCLISVFAMYPKNIVSRFMYPSRFEETGAAALTLWDTNKECWSSVLLDDYVPRSGEVFFGVGVSGPLLNEYWVSLFEKAFAKLFGGYPNLDRSEELVSVETVYKMLLGPFMVDYQEFYTPDDEETPSTFLTSILHEYSLGNILSFTSRLCSVIDIRDDINDSTGLLCYNGYGLLEIKQNVANTSFTLFKCQNPLSSSVGEWVGDWSDSSPLWDQYPNVKAELNFESGNDGIFWIEKADLYKAFSVIHVAKVQ